MSSHGAAQSYSVATFAIKIHFKWIYNEYTMIDKQLYLQYNYLESRYTNLSQTPLKGHGKRGHIVANTNVSPFARARNICWGHKFCVRDTKNVSDFVQKHFVSATNVSQFAQPKKHHGQQCVCDNVSMSTRALTDVNNYRCPTNDLSMP